MGTAFPMAEVISTYIPPSFYEIYYLYLYIGSMFFLLYMYAVLLRDKRKRKKDEEERMSKYSRTYVCMLYIPPNYYIDFISIAISCNFLCEDN